MAKKLIIVVLIIGGLALWGVSIYNKLVSAQETTEEAVGNVQTAYQQRADLIPNLVAAVKSYAEYEQGTLTAVVEARAKATSVNLDASNLTAENLKAFQEAQDQLSGTLSRLLVTVEKYPELKANQNYMDLQSKLESCENTIAQARKKFNETAKGYNTTLRRFPNNIVANMFDFEKMPYFEASESAQEAPNVGDLFK
ncbi:MAG: LemA family protein [Bacteroidales bacterium]|nr:LemA family protein [Bacteroidales bacterium]